MGTTATSLTTDDGVRYCLCLCIEGYEYLIVRGLATPSDILTGIGGTGTGGWNGLQWSSALGGLRVEGDFEQSMDPWGDKLQTNPLTFIVQDCDGTDRFGIDTHKTGAGDETTLTLVVAHDDTEILCTDNTDFEVSGDAWIGCERFAFDAKDDAQTFSVVTPADNRGTYHPFETDSGTAGRFARYHDLPSQDYDVYLKPKITDLPRVWAGRWVGLWMHRIVGDTIDTKAQASLLFAGKIEEIQALESGETAVICNDVFSVLKDTTLLHDQFKGRIRDGCYLQNNMWMRISYTYTSNGVPVGGDDSQLDVVPSGATGTDEVNAGYYTTDELVSIINAWLVGAAMDGDWSASITTETGEPRFAIKCENWPTGSTQNTIKFRVGQPVSQFLGFGTPDGAFHEVSITEQADPLSLVGTAEPLRTMCYQVQSGELTLDSSRGTWFDNQPYFPEPMKSLLTNVGENWGLIQIGSNYLAVAQYSSDTALTNVTRTDMASLTTSSGLRFTGPVLNYSDSGYFEVRQVAVLSGLLKNIIAKLFASTGTATYNSTTWDALPAQLGCAIPWTLLGDNFLRSLDSMQTVGTTDSIMVVIERPTKIEEVIMSELILRSTHLIWKSGGIRFVRPQRPAPSGLALHTLNEDNKAGRPGDALRAPSQRTSEFLRNIFKMEVNRDLTGKYHDTIEVRFAASIDEYGQSKPLTIKCRNAYGFDSPTVDTARVAAADFVALVAPLYGRPLLRLRRTIDFSLYLESAPGDLVTVSDNHMRDPADGTMKVSAKPGIIVAQRHSWGDGDTDMHGEVDILFMPQDNVSYYSPAALIKSYAADTPGAGQSTLTLYTSEHSESTEDGDVTHFNASDVVRVSKTDAADEAAPDDDTATIVSVTDAGGDADLIVLDDNLTCTITDKSHRVVSHDYGSAAATQKTDSYQADDADEKIVDARVPYVYGDYITSIDWTASLATELPERYSTNQYGDGVPLASAFHRAAVKMGNNLQSYRTAMQMPLMIGTATELENATTDYDLVWCAPYYIGQGMFFGLNRYLKIAPWLRTSNDTDGPTVSLRVTVSMNKPSGASDTDVVFAPPYKQLVFTSTSETWAIMTAQTVDPIVNAYGVGWISIELKTSISERPAETRGIAEFRLMELA